MLQIVINVLSLIIEKLTIITSLLYHYSLLELSNMMNRTVADLQIANVYNKSPRVLDTNLHHTLIWMKFYVLENLRHWKCVPDPQSHND